MHTNKQTNKKKHYVAKQHWEWNKIIDIKSKVYLTHSNALSEWFLLLWVSSALETDVQALIHCPESCRYPQAYVSFHNRHLRPSTLANFMTISLCALPSCLTTAKKSRCKLCRWGNCPQSLKNVETVSRVWRTCQSSLLITGKSKLWLSCLSLMDPGMKACSSRHQGLCLALSDSETVLSSFPQFHFTNC